MGKKGFIYLFIFIGGALGGYLPTLWGASALEVSSVIGSTIGGFFGLWAGYKIGKMIEG
ncbi:MAG: hypothetical protein WC289_00055 [Patescibacteria group bacterium]|jgi:hypothetical protein